MKTSSLSLEQYKELSIGSIVLNSTIVIRVDCGVSKGHIQFIDSVGSMEDFSMSIFGCFLPIRTSLTPGCERILFFGLQLVCRGEEI